MRFLKPLLSIASRGFYYESALSAKEDLEWKGISTLRKKAKGNDKKVKIRDSREHGINNCEYKFHELFNTMFTISRN